MDFVEHSLTMKRNRQDSKDQSFSNQGNKKPIIALATIPLVMTLGNSMLIPILPVMEDKLDISSFQSSMIITVYSIVAIILIPIAGFVSDHIGRKKVIITGLIIAGIGGAFSGWAAWKMTNSYWLILLGRSLQEIGAAGAAPIVMPLIGDLYKDEKEISSSLGLIETSNTFGKVLSPILGAFLAGFIWYFPFLAFPIFCFISLLLMIFLVKKQGIKYEPVPFSEFKKKVKEIFKHNWQWLLAVFFIGAILMFILFGVLFYLSDTFEKRYNMTGIKKGLFLAIPLLSLCISSLISGKLIKENKKVMKWVTFSGLLLLAGSLAALSFSKGFWFMIILFLFSGIGIGISLPCLDALITEGIEKEERGTITSIYHSMRFIGVAAGPPVTALLMNLPAGIMFYLLCGISLIAVLFTIKAIKPEN